MWYFFSQKLIFYFFYLAILTYIVSQSIHFVNLIILNTWTGGSSPDYVLQSSRWQYSVPQSSRWQYYVPQSNRCKYSEH